MSSGGFSNPIVAPGGGLVYPSIHSPNFLTGVQGWSINKNGNAEFNNGVFRGLLQANSVLAASISAASIGGAVITGSDFQGGTMEETAITFDVAGGLLLIYATTTATVTLPAGSGNWAAPANLLGGVVTAEAYAAGAGGSSETFSFSDFGGGGGGYVKAVMPVTPLTAYPYVAGAGGLGAAGVISTSGGDSTFAGDSGTLIRAIGGVAGDAGGTGGGAALTGVTGISFIGGAGGQVRKNPPPGSGPGGGGSAGSMGNGGSGHDTAGGQGGGLGGTGGAGGGGAGGAGGNGTTGTAGSNGLAPGGGGGGGGWNSAYTIFKNGGGGADGKIVLTWLTAKTLIGAVAAIAGADAAGNAYGPDFTGQLTAFQPLASPAAVETWRAMALAARWTNSGGTFPACQYRYLGSPPNSVEIIGTPTFTADGTTGLASGTALATLPAGYRPATNTSGPIPVAVTAGAGALVANRTPDIRISAAGVITMNGVTCAITNGTTVGIFFHGTFPLDA
jgi:hypothetical protein